MITRKIDRDDWLAGHSFEWAKKLNEKLKAQNGRLFVVCLERGNIEGMDGIEVFSLGKEKGNSRWQRFLNFEVLAARLTPKVDGVFCHQNPEYAIAVFPLAWLFRKPIVSWYTHKAVTRQSRWMLRVSRKVLTASDESFRITSKKVTVTGHGIDTDRFKKEKFKSRKKIFQILSLGRISPVKDLETLVLSLNTIVNEKKVLDVHLTIIGDIGTPWDQEYLDSLKSLVSKTGIEKFVTFKGTLPNHKVPQALNAADTFVNLSQTGSIDKAVLEAMACEVPVTTSNEAFFTMLEPFSDLLTSPPNDYKTLASKILAIKNLNKSDYNALAANLRRIVVENHSLDALAEKIVDSFKKRS